MGAGGASCNPSVEVWDQTIFLWKSYDINGQTDLFTAEFWELRTFDGIAVEVFRISYMLHISYNLYMQCE